MSDRQTIVNGDLLVNEAATYRLGLFGPLIYDSDSCSAEPIQFHFRSAGPPLPANRPCCRPPAQRPAYLSDTGPDAERPGDLALVSGVVMLASAGMPFRAHYQVRYPDGLTVFVPVDSPTVRLTVFPSHVVHHVIRDEPEGAPLDLEGLDAEDPTERALAVMLEGLEDV